MDTERELIDTSTLASEVEDTNLGVGYTTVEAGLGVRLFESKVLDLGFKSLQCLLFRRVFSFMSFSSL